MTICTPWRVANSLNQLLAQVNAKAPNRNKASDGSIGDPAHQAQACASQHNSCCVKVAGVWIIRARDFTHDPAGGFNSYTFADQLRLSHDPRIRYVISNHHITSASRNWQWESYDGSDPHTNHAHVSVWDDQARFDDTSRAWRIAPPTPAPIAPTTGREETDMFLVRYKDGSTVNPALLGTDCRTGLVNFSLFGSVAVATYDTMKSKGVIELIFNNKADADKFGTMLQGAPVSASVDVEALAAALAPLLNMQQADLLSVLKSSEGQAALVQAANTAEDS